MCQNLLVWDFYLWGGACYGYDNFWFGSLRASELLPKRRVLWALCYGYTYIVLVGCWLLRECDITLVFLSRLMRLER